jgi:hypothetical protein
MKRYILFLDFIFGISLPITYVYLYNLEKNMFILFFSIWFILLLPITYINTKLFNKGIKS